MVSVKGGSFSGILAMQLEQFAGSDCSGSDKAVNRVLTTTGVSGALGEIILTVGRNILSKTTDFTVSGNDITFVKPIFDAHEIEVRYLA